MKESSEATTDTVGKVVPKATKIVRLVAKSKGFKVTWKKQTTQTIGYEIRYSTKSSMSGAKTVTVNKKRL
jgi:hypothetical protein